MEDVTDCDHCGATIREDRYPEHFEKGIKNLEAFNVKLKEENAKLRGALRELYDSVVKEVCSQGDGYTEENLLYLDEFKKAKELLGDE